jgi:hypothetical protein
MKNVKRGMRNGKGGSAVQRLGEVGERHGERMKDDRGMMKGSQRE